MKGKAWIVVRREFFGTVKRPGWLISTFGMPVFVGLYAGLIFLIGSSAAKMDKPTGKAGIVDHSGIVRFEKGPVAAEEIPPEAKQAMDRAVAMAGASSGPAAELMKALLAGTEFVPFADEAGALAALDRKEVGAVYVLPADYLAAGKLIAYYPSESILSEGKLAQVPLRRMLLRSLAADRVEPEVVVRILNPIDSVKKLTKRRDGTWVERGVAELVRRIGVPIGFTVLLLISILTSAGALIQGVSEEKENRVIEVILSSIDARSLLLGKLLGLGGAGLLQLAVWLTMAMVPAVMLIAGLALSPMIVILCLAYFVLAFLLYGTLITGTGVIGTNAKDMQQYGMLWAIGSALPMPFIEVLLRDPNGTAARILSYFPLTSAVTMMIRIGSDAVAWWEVPLTLAVLAVSVWIALRFAARVFRTGLLMYGKRPSVVEVFRWMRQA
jgi:ABC-2 type transport system permease protein